MKIWKTLQNFFGGKTTTAKDRFIEELQTIQEELQKELQFWNAKCVEENERIQLLQNYNCSLSDEIEDARDALFSEVDYQTVSAQCKMFVKIENEIKSGKRECRKLRKRIECCRTQRKALRKELYEMQFRFEENEEYKIILTRRMEEAEKSVLSRRSQIAKQLSNDNSNANNCESLPLKLTLSPICTNF